MLTQYDEKLESVDANQRKTDMGLESIFCVSCIFIGIHIYSCLSGQKVGIFEISSRKFQILGVSLC